MIAIGLSAGKSVAAGGCADAAPLLRHERRSALSALFDLCGRAVPLIGTRRALHNEPRGRGSMFSRRLAASRGNCASSDDAFGSPAGARNAVVAVPGVPT